jgi:phage terminase large subunit-like protein
MATAAAVAPAPPPRSDCGRYWFDEAAADRAADFFPKHLRFTTGEFAGKPFRLEAWEADDIIRPLFGWKRDDGTRRYRRCIVWIPRKNGKTELAAGVSLLALLGDGELGGEVYSIARDKDQATIVFDKAAMMVAWSETLSRHLECYKTSIFCPELTASFKPLTGRPQGKHGLNASGLIGDEVHEWANGDLYTFVHQSEAARRQPIEFLISTAGNRIGYGWELWDYCQKVLAGEIDDPETLIVVYAAAPEDDWTDPATWAKANPNLGVSVKLDYLAEECRRAKDMPRLQNDFLRYHLNIWTEQAVRWLPMDAWDACGWPEGAGRDNGRWADPAFEAELEGRRCFGGMDLSTTTDLSAYCLWFEPLEPGGVWRKLTRAFVPQARIAERVKRDRAPYDQWLKSGALIATPGNVIDYDFIKAQLVEDATRFDLQQMVIDRFLSTQIAIQLNAEGIETLLMGQGFVSMSAPSKELERLALDRKIDHGGHPVARWCASNAAIATDPAGNIKPAKDKSTERIDVIVADVNALAGALAGQEETATPGIILL